MKRSNSTLWPLNLITAVLSVFLPGLSVEPCHAAVVAPTHLRCEYLKNPQGIEVSKPRLFWEDRSDARGFRQSAYQIELKNGDASVWDSGKVVSSETIQIEYGGPALAPGTRYGWRVRVWDQANQVSAWSESAGFSTGITQWQAQWIGRRPEAEWQERYQAARDAELKDSTGRWSRGENHPRDPMEWLTSHPAPIHDPAPLLRKGFDLGQPVKEALLFATGLGNYQLFLNGQRIDGGALAPGVTDYNKRVLYNTYDLTSMLKRGRNSLGLMLGRGWYNELCGSEPWGFSSAPWVAQPKAIAQLQVTFADGSQQTILTDSSWKAADGPVVFDDFRIGDVYDATREIAGWCDAGFDDAKWTSASVVPAPKGKLTSETQEPMRANAEFKANSVTALPETRNGWLFSFPQNIACQMRFGLDGAGLRGKPIKFTFYTYKEANGRLMTHSGPSYSYYICKGESRETIELPQFGYAGGRYVTVEGLGKKPSADDMTLIELRSGVETAGTLETSDPLLNRLHQNIRWTQANALHSFPQDCWTREKLGWTGDAHLTAEEAIYNFGMGAHYTKWMGDHLDVQGPDGGLAAFIPNFRSGNEGLTWSGTGIIIPWNLHTYYGDKRILAEMQDSGSRYLAAAPTMGGKPDIYFGGPAEWCAPWAKTIDQIENRNADLAVPYSTFPGGGEGHYVYGTAYYYRLAGILENIANLLGNPEVAQRWQQRREQVRTAFNREFFAADQQIYHGENPTDYRQAANIVPLWFGMVPTEVKGKVINNLVGDIVARHDGHLNTAVIGTQALFEELPRLGKADLAYEIAMQKTYPGYLWPMLHFGLTSLPEHWEGGGTHEHPFFGSVGAFLYKWLGGIQPDEQAPGFKHFWIRPSIDNPLEFVNSSYHSIRGLIRSEWRKSGSTLALTVEVPANSEADVEIPKFGYSAPQIEEGGQIIWQNGKFKARTGLLAATDLPAAVRICVSGGIYHFRVDSPELLAAARKAGIDLRVAAAVVYPGESAAISVQASGNLGEAKLVAKSTSGVRIVDVQPAGAAAWTVKVAAAASHPVWQAEPISLTLTGVAEGKMIEIQKSVPVAVRAVVEVRYPRPEVHVAPGYAQPQTLFHLRNRRAVDASFVFSAKIPDGWSIQFVVNDRKLAAGEPVKLAPKAFTKVETILLVPANAANGQRMPVAVTILENGRQVGEFKGTANTLSGKVTDSFRDDFKTLQWKAEGELKLESKAGHAEVSTPAGRVDAMTSDWMVMDCSKPLRCIVRTSSVQGEWCLQLDDGKTTQYLIGDTRTQGVMEGNFSQLNLDGLQRFRLRFLAIGRPGDCRIGLEEISIKPKD
jgi:alpha-L-rhamnosidase